MSACVIERETFMNGENESASAQRLGSLMNARSTTVQAVHVVCKNCGRVLMPGEAGACPSCGGKDFELVSSNETIALPCSV